MWRPRSRACGWCATIWERARAGGRRTRRTERRPLHSKMRWAARARWRAAARARRRTKTHRKYQVHQVHMWRASHAPCGVQRGAPVRATLMLAGARRRRRHGAPARRTCSNMLFLLFPMRCDRRRVRGVSLWCRPVNLSLKMAESQHGAAAWSAANTRTGLKLYLGVQ